MLSWNTYNPVNESDELLLVLLSLNEVGLDQRLQLSQILLLTLPVDILQSRIDVFSSLLSTTRMHIISSTGFTLRSTFWQEKQADTH